VRTSLRTKSGKVQVFGADAEFLLGTNGEVATSIRALLSADASIDKDLATSIRLIEENAEADADEVRGSVCLALCVCVCVCVYVSNLQDGGHPGPPTQGSIFVRILLTSVTFAP
jgi:predicted RNA-binding protein YlqC (UPF0109 family)